jgi:hypothetical protein
MRRFIYMDGSSLCRGYRSHFVTFSCHFERLVRNGLSLSEFNADRRRPHAPAGIAHGASGKFLSTPIDGVVDNALSQGY